jgi:hypothetical protein
MPWLHCDHVPPAQNTALSSVEKDSGSCGSPDSLGCRRAACSRTFRSPGPMAQVSGEGASPIRRAIGGGGVLGGVDPLGADGRASAARGWLIGGRAELEGGAPVTDRTVCSSSSSARSRSPVVRKSTH